MRVLVVNAGSSSVKLSLLDGDDVTLAASELDAPESRVDERELRATLQGGLREADAVAHRIVHGGERFHGAVRIDAGVESALRDLVDLAPLHQRKSLAALDAVTALLPDIPAVACFDTTFHATLPPAAATYALPAVWRERYPIRRYGFHGLSHGWVARRVPALTHRDSTGLRVVSCHLGAGGSLCAIADGRSIDTTMGFTPLEGLVMATRSGSVDPGLVLWLLDHAGLSGGEIAEALEHRSGLLGLAGTADMREILSRAEGGDGAAQLALDVYSHRLRGGIAAMAASLGGLDVLAFTGGVGEHSPAVRNHAVSGLGFLGVELSPQRNDAAAGDCEISGPASAAAVVVIEAREDLEMARQARDLLGA